MIVVRGKNLCQITWANLKTQSAVAASQHQAALSAVTKSLQFEWIFTIIVIRDCGSLFTELENCLSLNFIPVLFGVELNSSYFYFILEKEA